MKNEKYCPECGKKITGPSRFCPRCGAKLGETTTPKENNNIRKYLLIGLVIAIISSTCLLAYAGITTANNAQTYERVNISNTCSLELPNIHFDVDNSSSNVNSGEYSMKGTYKYLTSHNPYIHISYGKTVDNFGLSSDYYSNDGGQVSVNGETLYHRSIYNAATGEMIMISGTNKTMVDHIADSVKFSTGTPVDVNNTTDSGSSSSTSTQYVWYDDTGMPHYFSSAAEAQAAYNKYIDEISGGSYDSGSSYSHGSSSIETTQDSSAWDSQGSQSSAGEQSGVAVEN